MRIVDVAHRGAPGGLFDRAQERGDFIEELKPANGEPVAEKTFASAFAGTELERVRAGIERGYATTVAADACATRDLPLSGRVAPAAQVHEAEFAGLGDAHAAIRTVA